ncbi:MAG: hypothetical protein P8130_02860 [Deltaproteobacteria bacterium]
MGKRAKPGSKLVYLVSCAVIGLGLIFTGFAHQNGAGTALAEVTSGAEFAWHANRPGITRAQIALGRATRLRFEFKLNNADGQDVKFGISKKYAEMGISISPNAVTIADGMANAAAEFSCPPGMPLGKFDMLIVMVDAKTKKELGRGFIPFMLLPAGVGGC